MSLPRSVDHAALLDFVRSLSGLPPPRVLQPVAAVALETYADAGGIRHYLSIPGHVQVAVDSWLTTHLPGASLEPVSADADVVALRAWTGVELTLSSHRRQLKIPSPPAVAATILSGFSTLADDEAVVLQWLIFPAAPRSPADVEPGKTDDAIFNAVVRLGAVGDHRQRLIRDVAAGLSMTHSFGIRFRRRLLPHAGERIRRRAGALAYPVFVNAVELSCLLGWPFGAPNVAGLSGSKARHLAPDNMIDRTGIVLGTSNFPKLRGRKLALPHSALTVHIWVAGPSGSGKSVLLHNIAAQVMEAGMGLVLIEPKGDLASDVLASVPASRVRDVIWFDPTDTNRPIGLNVLAGPDPERITGHIVGMFQNLYGDSWGSRLERILRYSVLTAALNGLTLYDVKQLLVNKDFRGRIVRQTKDNEARQFWRWLDVSSDTYVDSVVNKLDSFLGSRAIRNIVGQQSGLDMGEIVRQRKILLVPLPSALLGQANAAMLGSLMREMLWDEVRRREPGKREPIILMLDEFQNYADFSTTKSDPFAEARSYGLSLIIANQHTGQLPPSVLASVKANTGSKVVFALDPDDAKRLRDNFSPLTADDLQSLPRYGVALSVMTSSGRAPTATGLTAPPPPPTGAGYAALAASQARYGRPVSEVEAELAERHRGDDDRPRPPIGRVT